MQVNKRNEKATDEECQIFQQLFDTQVMSCENVNALYDVADDIIDLSMSVFEVGIEYVSDRMTTLDKKVVIRSIEDSDIENYFFDCNVNPRRINYEGRYQGRILHVSEEQLKRMKDINGRTIEIPKKWYNSESFRWEKDNKYKLIDYFERYYKTIKIGHYQQPGNAIPVKIEKSLFEADQKLPSDQQQYRGYIYLGKKTKVDGKNYAYPDCTKEVYEVHYWRFFNDYLIASNVVEESVFPYLVNFGVLSNDVETKQPVLVPFYDHVIDTQKLMDYSTSSTVYALQMSALGDKYLIPDGLVTQKQFDEHWKNRNTSSGDLPYTPFRDQAGNILPIRPERMEPQTVPAIAEYLMQSAPNLIQGMLGTNLEQDVTLNTSGEAIRQRRLIQSKSAKIYKDYAFQAFVDAGERIKELIPFAFNNERYISVNKNGQTEIVPINKQTGTEKKINDIQQMQELYDLTISLGSTPIVRKEKTQQAMQMLYSTLPPPLGPQIASATADIYASSLDFPQADEVARRISAFVDPNIVALGNGKITLQQYQQQAQQAQQQAQQNSPEAQMMQEKMQTEAIQNQTKRQQAQVDAQKAQMELESTQIRAQADRVKSHADIIKANAEIGKNLTNQEPQYD